MEKETPDYQTVCKFVGQLYLETRTMIEELSRRLIKAESERDQALNTFMNNKNE